MREILFRGKRESDNKWIYGYYADDNAYDVDFPCIFPLRNCTDDGDWAVIRNTVGQYTGLTDKNGKKIFEGDILECRYDVEFPEERCFAEVLWVKDETGTGYRARYACFNCAIDDIDKDLTSKYCEVIGNIIDNPELLEVRECQS